VCRPFQNNLSFSGIPYPAVQYHTQISNCMSFLHCEGTTIGSETTWTNILGCYNQTCTSFPFIAPHLNKMRATKGIIFRKMKLTEDTIGKEKKCPVHWWHPNSCQHPFIKRMVLDCSLDQPCLVLLHDWKNWSYKWLLCWPHSPRRKLHINNLVLSHCWFHQWWVIRVW
jgi:hypothetical protein